MVFMVSVPGRSLLGLVFLAAVAPPIQAAQDTARGAVVESVAAASAAGLLPGDQKALELDLEKSLSAAQTLLALGQTTAKKGDFEGAEAFLQQGLAIYEELAPGSLELAGALNKLGVLARWRGNLDAAEAYLTRAEEIRRRLAPGSAGHGLILINLGNVAMGRGDLTRSESLHRKALALFEGIEPDGGAVVGCLQNLADVLTERGDLAGADELLRRKLDIQERRGASEWESWSTLTSLGILAMERGDLEAAEVYYRRALAIQERKPSPDGREIALSLGSLGEVALEKGDFTTARDYLRRAQDIEEKLEPTSLTAAEGLETLARLEVKSGGDLAAAEDLLRRALALFEQEAPGSVDISVVLRDLGEIAGRRGRVEEALALGRRALDLQSRLAPGSIGEASTLYSLGRAERQAGRNEEGIRDLCRAVDVVDRQRIRLGGTPEEKTSFEATLGQYYRACLEGRIELGQTSEAFHVLERGRARSFLALLAERDLRLAGDPVYRPATPDGPAGAEAQGAARTRLALARLPSSGREVKAIAGLFPRARVYLGADATEERVKSLGPETRLIHFACHGLLDERFPLNSALALSVPGPKAEGQDNGLLQAWEIFESVRLDADLVTLSACDTALGREMGGEGLVGLTRAFQYAGARSVLASLWSVADSSTTRFMQSFYGNLRKGMSKDEALRAAQIERIRDTHPFHWAAFQLTGDWR